MWFILTITLIDILIKILANYAKDLVFFLTEGKTHVSKSFHSILEFMMFLPRWTLLWIYEQPIHSAQPSLFSLTFMFPEAVSDPLFFCQFHMVLTGLDLVIYTW